ncbi:MAG: P-loop NTPase [Chloroflexi bacterium]|jgi:CO dehydrogenase maturation factor|nr:P-loop NTPase [Chloroflexota bacterium]MBT7080840.1 P-loop NTPase [Chloroflexota bacterium]
MMKKISISGKGGTGKSMVTTLLSGLLVEQGYTVLTVDSDDSNPGLYRMLGFDEAPRPLIDLFGGENQIVTEIKLRQQKDDKAPTAEWLNKDTFTMDDIPAEYMINRNGQKLLSVGKISVAFEGCACPMAEVLKIFLDKLVLAEKEIMIVDMEAGVEHFGRGVDKSIDTVLILVEPTVESISLASKVYFLARGSKIDNIWAVLNKMPTEAIAARVKGELDKRKIKVAGTVYFDPQISEYALEGKPLTASKAKEDVRQALEVLLKEE